MKKNEFIVSGTIKLPLTIYCEKRKNSRISIGKKGIYIRLPLTMTETEKKAQVKKFTDWAKKKMEIRREYLERHLKPGSGRSYRDGDVLRLNKGSYIIRLSYTDKKTSSSAITGKEIRLIISSRLTEEERLKECTALLSRCIAKQRLPALKKRIEELNKKHFRKKTGKIFYKYNKSNWGSCSSRGNINISTRLLFAPEGVLDYVCVHELAHLIEKNHSHRFWSLVRKVMPDYKKRKNWLKENYDRCWF
ncbi:MAG: M48 family metallopeptidase [Spirochaetales bacterium]|nr:M48 family metallopeptidase [Spirochaetales bacterium]